MVDATEKLPLPCSNPPLTYGQVIPIKFCGLTPPHTKKEDKNMRGICQEEEFPQELCVCEGGQWEARVANIHYINEWNF